MELKYLVLLSILGVAAGFTLPQTEGQSGQGESSGDLQSSFSPISTSDADSSQNLSRDKRGLLFKKKHSGSNTVYVNRRYEGSSGSYDYRPNREIHHHHHYTYPAPQQQTYQPYPAPPHEYHHYHGASTGYEQGYANHGSSYYSGAYAAAGTSGYQRPNYGDGGYANYGGYGQAPPPQAPISAAPLATAHNNVDRGQGAAAVNNIAIIHARSGTSNSLAESESRVLPKPLPIDVADALSMLHDD